MTPTNRHKLDEAWAAAWEQKTSEQRYAEIEALLRERDMYQNQQNLDTSQKRVLKDHEGNV